MGYKKYPNRLDVFVTDTGVGIEEHLKELIFDRFRQAEASIHISEGGAGLGLSICKAYAEMMGAQLKLESNLGGSTFILSFPNEKIEAQKNEKA